MKEKPGQDARSQYAALPFKDEGDLEIMLVSSRETRRWIVPKGWPMKGRKPHAAAAQEALEEAGLVGAIGKASVGRFHYIKRRKNGSSTNCEVTVFPLRVERQLHTWPEKNQRTTRWFSVEEAAELVQEPELQEIIRAFGRLAQEQPESLPPHAPRKSAAIDAPAGP